MICVILCVLDKFRGITSFIWNFTLIVQYIPYRIKLWKQIMKNHVIKEQQIKEQFCLHSLILCSLYFMLSKFTDFKDNGDFGFIQVITQVLNKYNCNIFQNSLQIIKIISTMSLMSKLKITHKIPAS